jgi:hypothetical protein
LELSAAKPNVPPSSSPNVSPIHLATLGFTRIESGFGPTYESKGRLELSAAKPNVPPIHLAQGSATHLATLGFTRI